MELKEGMYVRFDYHRVTVPIQIGKITEVHYDKDEKYYFYLTDNSLVIGENNLVKEPSYDITGLIEVGDYVNGEKITRVIPQDICGDEVLDYQHIFVNDREIFKEDIKSIVTKEQFESMSYKVGD